MRRRTTSATAALAATLALSGCGVPERVSGVRDAPVEVTTGAAYTTAAAQQIATRVLGKAAEAAAAGQDATIAQRAVLTGPAHRLSRVRDKFHATTNSPPVLQPSEPQILGVTSGRSWPRTILATTLSAGVQNLHVLVAPDVHTPFRLWVTVPMAAGASVPALPAEEIGTATVDIDSGNGLIASPRQILQSYADQLDVPAETSRSAIVSIDDPFAKSVRAASRAQVRTLGKLGTFTRDNSLYLDDVLGIRLADGSVLAFGQMVRRDVVKPTAKARRIDLPAELSKLSGKKSVAKVLDLQWLETMAFVIPATATAELVGVSEQMRAITAR